MQSTAASSPETLRIGPTTRVVLVGRTGLDAALRLDQRLELARVRTLVEAVAELSEVGELTNGAGHGPGESTLRDVCVVVAEDLARDAEQTGRWERFLSQCRQRDPAVRILVVTGAAARWPGATGVVDPALGPAALRELVMAPAARSGPVGAAGGMGGGMGSVGVEPGFVALSGQAAPVITVPQTGLGGDSGGMGTSGGGGGGGGGSNGSAGSGPTAFATTDASLVALMLRGTDIGPAAIAMIRDRLRDPSIEFVPAGDEASVPMSAGSVACDVSAEGARLGVLRARGTHAELLLPHARWLGLWLRLRDQQTQLRDAAFTDPLTGAFNRRYFDRFLLSALHEAQTRRNFVSVALFDLDNFKQFNDLYGHEAGDDVLREVVRLLSSTIRPTDRVCRLGGDEFAVIFHDPAGPRQEGSKHPAAVQDIALRFQKQVAAHKFPKLAQQAPGPLGVSGGLATFPWDGRTSQELLARADELLLLSKRQGKNAIVFGPVAGGPGGM